MSYQNSDIILKIIGWLIVFPLLLVRIHHCRILIHATVFD